MHLFLFQLINNEECNWLQNEFANCKQNWFTVKWRRNSGNGQSPWIGSTIPNTEIWWPNTEMNKPNYHSLNRARVVFHSDAEHAIQFPFDGFIFLSIGRCFRFDKNIKIRAILIFSTQQPFLRRCHRVSNRAIFCSFQLDLSIIRVLVQKLHKLSHNFLNFRFN